MTLIIYCGLLAFSFIIGMFMVVRGLRQWTAEESLRLQREREIRDQQRERARRRAQAEARRQEAVEIGRHYGRSRGVLVVSATALRPR